MDWDDYRYFLVCARSASVRAAAFKIGVSHSTVLRRLDNLEKKLGARLFDQRGNGFPLTLAGEDVLLGAAEIEDSLQSIERVVAGQDEALAGLVTISMPEVLINDALIDDLAYLKEKYPQIKLKIDITYSVANLAMREADIAIRLTHNPPEELIGRCVGEIFRAAYATQKYISKHKPNTKNSSAKWIGYGNPEKWIPNSPFPELDYIGVFDNVVLQTGMVKKNKGIGYLPCMVGEKEEGLIRLSEPERVSDLWVLYHADLRSTTRIRVIRDYILEAMKRRILY